MPGESKEAQDAKHVASMRRTATDNPTSIYRPTGTGAGWGWGMAALDGKPFYTWFDVPRMIRDPRVRFLERMWRSPFQQATWTVKATHPKVQQYVDSQLKKFWRESLPALLQRYFWFGFAPGGAEFSQRKGLVRLDGVRPLEPLDARPLLFHGGPHDGRMAGLEFGTTKVCLPHAFWFSGEKRFGPYYDMPPAGGMFEPWAEKRGRNGAIDMRRTWFHKNSSRGIVVRHPPGRTESSDEFPGGRDNQSIARELIDYSETNSSLTLTNEKHPSDPSHFAWEVEWPESFPDRAGFREYPKDLDAEMAEGVGIPREVLEAAATGSGYSGRQIPLQAWLGGVDEYVGMLLRSCEWLKWAVMINFGPNAYFEVETESLVKKLLEDSKGPGGMGGAVQNMVNPQPQPGGDAQGKIPPGMVPHKGPRGGGGYEDPNTGRRRYLSDERSPSDELSEEQIARRVAKMLLRKHREEQAALELSDGRTPDLATHRKQLLVLLAMLEFQRRAHAVGDSASSAPYLEALTQYLKNPNSLRYPLELSWRADETRTGHIRAVGEAEHAGRVLYGARAEAALRAQEGLRSGLKPGERAPKTPTPHANRDQWQKAGLRAREILAKVAGYEHTPEDLQELGQHLPYLPMDRLMNARSILRAKFKGARGRLAQVGALMDHIREQVGVMDQKATEEAKVAEAVGDAVPVHPLDYLAANHANPELMAGKKQDLAIHDAINAAYRGEFGPEMKAAVNKGGHWDNHGGDIAKRFASIGKAIAEAKQKPKEEPAAPMDEKHSKRAKGYRDEATSVDPKDVSHADTHEASAAAEQPAADVPGFAEGGNLFDKSQFDTDDRPEAIQTLHTILGHAKQFVPGIGAPTAKHAEKLAAYNAEAKRYDAKAKELEDRKKSGSSVFTKRDHGRLTDYKRWADDARKNAAKLTGGAAEVDDYLDQLAAVDKYAGEDADEGFFGKLSANFRGNAEELADIDVETHAEAQEHVKEIMDQARRDFARIDRTRKDIIQDLSLKGETDLADFYSRYGKEATRVAVADLEKRAQEKLESHKQRDEKNKAEQEELERKNGEEADAKIAEHNARMDEQPTRKETYINGDRAEFTGNSRDGMHEYEMMEGHRKGQRGFTARGPDGSDPYAERAKKEWAEQQADFKKLTDEKPESPARPVAEGAHPALAHLDPVKHAREAAHVDAGEDALLEKVRQTGNAFHEAQQAHRMVGSSQPEKRNATKALNAAAKAHEAAQAEVDRYNQHRPNHNARLNGVAVDEKQPLFVRIAAARRAMGGHTGNVVEEILPHVKQYLEENGHDPRIAGAVAADAMNFPMRSAKRLKEVIQGEETRQKIYDERKEAREHIKGLDLLPHHAAEAEREAGNLYQGDVDRFKEKWSNTAENTKAEKARQVEAERIAKERAEKENASKSAADAYLAAHREGKTLPSLAPDAAREVASHVLMAPTQWHAGTELPKADGPKGIVDRLAKEDSTRFALAKTITEQGWGTDSKYAVKATPAMVEHAKAKGLDKLEGRTPSVKDFVQTALAQNLSPAKIVATKQKAEDGLPDVLVQSEDGAKQATLDGRYVANIMGIYPKATMQVAGEGKPVVFMVGDEPVGLVMPRATGDDARIEQFSPHARPQFSDVFAPGSYAPEDIEEMGDAVVAGRGEHSMRLRILGRKGGGYTISSSHKPADNVADREYPNRGEAVAAAKEMLAHAHGIDEDGKLIFKAKGEKPGDLHPEEKARVGYYKDLREKVKAVKGKPQKMAFGDGEKEVHPATEHFGVAKGKTGGWEALHLPSGLSIGDWARKDDAIGHAIATQEMPGADWNDTFADTDDEGVKADRKELFDRARKLQTAFENNELPEHAKPTDQPDEPGAGEAATPKPPQGPSPISATSPAMAPKAGEQQTFAGWMPGASTPRKPAEAKPRARGAYEWRKNKSDKWAWFEGDRQITGAFPNESDADYAFDAFALKDGPEQSDTKPAPTIKDHPEYDRLNQVYGGMTKQEIDKKLSQMDADIAQNQHVAKREFNQNGGRRSGPAMAAQAARDLGEEKLLLKAYQNEKFPSEPQAAGADSGPVAKPDAMKNPFREQQAEKPDPDHKQAAEDFRQELLKQKQKWDHQYYTVDGGGRFNDMGRGRTQRQRDKRPYKTPASFEPFSQFGSMYGQYLDDWRDGKITPEKLAEYRKQFDKFKAGDYSKPDSGEPRKPLANPADQKAEQERRRKLKQDVDDALAEHMRTTLKPGDTVYINGDTPITVKKANKATVTTELGSTWKYSELTPKHQSEDRPMTAREMVDLARGKMAEKEKGAAEQAAQQVPSTPPPAVGSIAKLAGARFVVSRVGEDGTVWVKNDQGMEWDLSPRDLAATEFSAPEPERPAPAWHEVKREDFVQGELASHVASVRATVESAKSRLRAAINDKGFKVPFGISPEQYARAHVTEHGRPDKDLASAVRELDRTEHNLELAKKQQAETKSVIGTHRLTHETVHRNLVSNALASGKHVPAEVLADYPDLAAKYAAPSSPQDTQPPSEPKPATLAGEKPPPTPKASNTDSADDVLERMRAANRPKPAKDVAAAFKGHVGSGRKDVALKVMNDFRSRASVNELREFADSLGIGSQGTRNQIGERLVAYAVHGRDDALKEGEVQQRRGEREKQEAKPTGQAEPERTATAKDVSPSAKPAAAPPSQRPASELSTEEATAELESLRNKYRGPGMHVLSAPKPGSPEYNRDDDRQTELQERLGKMAWQRRRDAIQNVSGMPPEKHRKYVEQALASGKPVPPEVLADYPDLAAKKAKHFTGA